MARLLCITAMLASEAALGARTTPKRLAKMGQASLATVPMRMFKEDCKLQRPIAALVQNPGAGMDPSPGPYKMVLKDGYFHVECVKDYMFVHGDKFGDNKFSYELGTISNVSIVHYSAGVAREDRQPMSHDTCFAFCRTVPEMLFFGVTNGRECYCAPYYKPMAGDSSNCDAVCEGDTTTMCGGKTKSSIFEMHACQNTATDLLDSSQKLTDVDTAMGEVVQSVTTTKDLMQQFGTELKQVYGQAGDVAAAALMQKAVNFAGELEVAVKQAEALTTKATDLKKKEGTFASANFEDAATATDAEGLISEMEQLTAEMEAMTEELETLKAKSSVKVETSTALSQYYEAMYFVNKTKTSLPSTCTGDLAAAPMIGTAEACAAACDAARSGQTYEFLQHGAGAKESQGINKRAGGCVGFSVFETVPGGGANENEDLCFIFSKLESLTYYSHCEAVSEAAPEAPPATLLQKTASGAKVVPHGTACMAKLQYFEGTTLAPDASGKCEKCLKKVTHAERCPSHLPLKA